jgi:hypothetical protein
MIRGTKSAGTSSTSFIGAPFKLRHKIAVIAFVSVCTFGPNSIAKCARSPSSALKNTPTVSVHSSSFLTSSKSNISPSFGPQLFDASA